MPADGAPTKTDWERVSRSWRGRLNDRIAELEQLRDELTGCTGCGCLSLQRCRLYNPGDFAAEFGTGPGTSWATRLRSPPTPSAVAETTGLRHAPLVVGGVTIDSWP